MLGTLACGHALLVITRGSGLRQRVQDISLGDSGLGFRGISVLGILDYWLLTCQHVCAPSACVGVCPALNTIRRAMSFIVNYTCIPRAEYLGYLGFLFPTLNPKPFRVVVGQLWGDRRYDHAMLGPIVRRKP